MTDMRGRYDQAAQGYARWWGPVLERSAVAVLDLVAGPRSGERWPVHIVDLGTGTGVLARAAVRRWPGARVTGLDFSRGMLALAAELAQRQSTAEERRRLAWIPAGADRAPLPGGSVDAVISSFVFQLVPSRAAVYREVLRVLRPGGRLAFVTWLLDETPFPPSEAFEDALEELDLPSEEGGEADEEPRAGDFVSPRAAADSLRRAGFRNVHAERRTLEHAFTPEGFARYKVEYDERTYLRGLDRGLRERVTARFRERLAPLSASDLLWRAPLVYARGDRPASRRTRLPLR